MPASDRPPSPRPAPPAADSSGGADRLKRWSRAHSRSVVSLSGNGREWAPVVHLVWLVYVVAAPVFISGISPLAIGLTYASLPVFLLIYWRAYFGDSARLAWNAAAMTALALAIVPLGTSWSYVIYAGVLISLLPSARRAWAGIGGLLVAFCAVAAASGWPPILIAGAAMTTALISLVNLYHAVNVRRDAELRLSQSEVRRLAASAERERIGRDLHDLLGHTLSLIALKTELAEKLFDRDPVRARAELRETQGVARQALAEVRAAVTGIRAGGLAAERAASRRLLESAGIGISERITGPAPIAPLPAAVEDVLSMVLREAVTNVQRHAGARQVEFELAFADDAVTMRLSDDGSPGVGRGFEGGNGIRGMRERLAGCGGELAIESLPSGGTRLVARVPLRSESAAVETDRRGDETRPASSGRIEPFGGVPRFGASSPP